MNCLDEERPRRSGAQLFLSPFDLPDGARHGRHQIANEVERRPSVSSTSEAERHTRIGALWKNAAADR